jgi:hypothetical protein
MQQLQANQTIVAGMDLTTLSEVAQTQLLNLLRQAAGIIANEVPTNPDLPDDSVAAYLTTIATIRTAQVALKAKQAADLAAQNDLVNR